MFIDEISERDQYYRYAHYIKSKAAYDYHVNYIISQNTNLLNTWNDFNIIFKKETGSLLLRSFIEKMIGEPIDCLFCRHSLPSWVVDVNTSIPKTNEIQYKIDSFKKYINIAKSYDVNFQNIIKNNTELTELWDDFKVYYTIYYEKTKIPRPIACSKNCCTIDWRDECKIPETEQ